MSNADRNGAASVSLPPEDQDRLYNLAVVHLGSLWPSEPFDAETPKAEAAQRLRAVVEEARAALAAVDAAATGSLLVTPDVRAYLQRSFNDTQQYLEGERSTLRDALCGAEVYAGLSSQEAANELRGLVSELEADVALLRRILAER